MSYLDAHFLSETMTIERVTGRGNDGNQDKTYSAAENFGCREETISETIIDMNGDEVLATSKVFIDAAIFSVPEGFAKYTLPSGQKVRLAKAKAIKGDRDAGTIEHWEAHFTKA